MKRFILSLFIFLIGIKVFAVSPITLEHTFDGIYYPYNFNSFDGFDTPCFSDSKLDTATGEYTIKTYSENYSLIEQYEGYIDEPYGYKARSMYYNPSCKFSDGTAFITIIFESQSLSYGANGYCIAKIYNATNGQIIADLGMSSSGILIDGVYNINGKPSIRVSYLNFEGYNFTKIYSLGITQKGSIGALNDNHSKVESIHLYDLNGIPIKESIDGQVYIKATENGTTNKLINH